MAIGAKRKAKIELGATTSEMDKGLAEARRKLRSFGADMRKTLGERGLKSKYGIDPKKFGGGGKGRNVGGGFMGGMVAGGAAMLVGGGLLDVGSQILAVEKALTRFQIAGEVSQGTMSKFRKELLAVSNATGVSRGELVSGAQAYVALTGDAAGAIEATRLFGEVSAGTGAAMEDVAATAAALRQNLKIDPKNFRAAFDVLVKQGKIGAIEIKDLATKMANIAPQFSTFAGARSVEGMSELGAMLQVAKQGFGSADEAATGFNGMMTQLNRNQKKLKKVGVNVVDPKTGKFKNLLQIVREIGANTKLAKPGALLDVMGEEKAVRAMSVLIENLREVDRIKQESLNSDQVAKDNLAFQSSTAGKLQRAMEAAKNTIAETFTPERIQMFAETLVKVVELAAKLVGFIDTIGKKVGEVVGHATSDVEKRARADVDKEFDAAMKGSAADKRKTADALFSAAGELGARGHQGGLPGRYQDAYVEAANIRASELRKAGDQWGGGVRADEKPELSEKLLAGLSMQQKLDVGFGSLKYEIAAAIRDGLKGLKIEADGNALARTVGNATEQRRPGKAR